MGVYDKLYKVQAELKAPKGQYNSFGKYKYRSCEDILEALKPLLFKHSATVTLSDSATPVGDRFYIEATASFIDSDDGSMVVATAYAREPDTKKGMEVSQITGTASSYARKYALNGLFLIDDTKDPDTDEYHKQTSGEDPYLPTKNGKVSSAQLKKLAEECKRTGVSEKEINELYGISSIKKEMTEGQILQELRRQQNMKDKG